VFYHSGQGVSGDIVNTPIRNGPKMHEIKIFFFFRELDYWIIISYQILLYCYTMPTQVPEQACTEHCRYVNYSSDLEIVKDPCVNIAIHHRELPSELDHFLNIFISKDFEKFSADVSLDNFEELFENHFAEFRSISPLAYDLLKEDIYELIKLFIKTFNVSSTRVMFGIVDKNMCTKFHVDMYDYRMLCTYKGLGTCWIKGDKDMEVFNQRLLSDKPFDEDEIQQVKESDVVILKGGLAPNSKIGGIVHKSPHIEGSSQNRRVLLRIDGNSLPVMFGR